MSKKVTKQIIRNNLESYVAQTSSYIDTAEKLGLGCTEIMALTVGARVMAEYVIGVIDGDHPVDNDITHLATILADTAKPYVRSLDEAAEDEDEEDFMAVLYHAFDRIDKHAVEEVADDDADSE